MKVKLFFSIVFSLFTMTAFSQVGIGKTTSSATLDVAAIATDASTAEGFIAPRLTGNQLTAKNAQYGTAQNGTMVYVTEVASATTGKTKNIKSIGYYFYDATAESGAGLWIAFADETKEQFYVPTLLLPTDMYSLPDNTYYTAPATNRFTVNLFGLFKEQLGNPKASSNSIASLQTGSNTATDYYYFILYYDTTVYTSVSVTTAGVMTYYLVSGYTPSEKTFMNIMLREK
ncbi:hypothetical protein [Dysgonomonas macrotermitis]|uniref:Uncharacterized protein n=1 Tax=Dysgonomonas macrotermitis TaxID=1346286 RepID=A0A1M4TW37_9BACT|nr:hypothetical protein [Dysgonomonas macrotermitis]SHE48662.1 hypothetical protein SAMN05444362_101436 [Dysgonomonas macrotermitis]